MTRERQAEPAREENMERAIGELLHKWNACRRSSVQEIQSDFSEIPLRLNHSSMVENNHE